MTASTARDLRAAIRRFQPPRESARQATGWRSTQVVAKIPCEEATCRIPDAMKSMPTRTRRNREEQGARAVLDACLSLARSYLENGSPEQAEDHALACRLLMLFPSTLADGALRSLIDAVVPRHATTMTMAIAT